MRNWFTFAVCSLALVGMACAQESIEVADGRAAGDLPDLSAWAARPAVQQAFGAARAYWKGKDAGYEEDVRVLGVASGAFTEPGVEQQAVLYLMSLWPRCCPKMGLAFVDGDQLVRNVAFEGVAQQLSTLSDLDADGRDELVLVGEFGMGGEVSRSLTLVAFGADGLVERGGAALYSSDCAASGQSGSTALHVTALPGPAFRAQRYTATCESEAWQAAGDPEALELYAGSTTYANLPVR